MLDSTLRVRGTVPYVLNAEAPGAATGLILRSRYPHARIRVDTSRAMDVSGVFAVISGHDLGADSGLSPGFGPIERDQPTLAMERVRYVGEPVAAVAAVDADAATEALSLIQVEYEEIAPVLDLSRAMAEDAPLLHESHPGNLAAEFFIRKGDLDAGFAQAEGILESEYLSPPVQHVPLEPHVVLARVEPGGKLVVESSTQTPHHLRRQLAEIFGVPISRVRVIVPTLGGGFGGKCYPEIEPLALLLALKARRPVKITLSRAEEFVTSARQASRVHLKTGYTRDGLLLAVDADVLYENGAYLEVADRVIRHGARSLTAPYRIPHVRIRGASYFTNATPCGPFRAPGAAQAVWAWESHLDEIATKLHIDPLEIRLRNLVRSGESYVDGGLLEDIRYPEMLKVAAAAVGWGKPSPARLATGEHVGRGLAVVMKTTNTPSTSTATVKMNEDGSLDVLTSSVEMGQGSSTVLVQIAAEKAGVDVGSIRLSQVDTDVTPFDHSTSSSRTTFAMGDAIGMAIEVVKKDLRELAGAHFEASPDDVELGHGRAAVRGAPDRSVQYGALIRGSRRGNLIGHAINTTSAKPDPTTGGPGASAHYHQAAGAAEVAVDPETGRIRVLRLHSAVFAGRAINPTLCELQVDGSALFGLGQALFEEIHEDGGQITNANLGDYLIPALRDVPDRLDSAIYEERGHDEVHGIGEVAAPLAPPAIANAVADAIGVRIRELPLTPERVLRALAERARHE